MIAARTITFTLNGAPVTADVKPHHNLVEMLQAQFGLTGARESCGQGLCGCCSVVVNGRAVSGCLYLALFVDGAEVITVESLDTPAKLSPVDPAVSRRQGRGANSSANANNPRLALHRTRSRARARTSPMTNCSPLRISP